jgi:predicted porin
MKKHLIALAVAGVVSVPAMAQNVTISGILDTGIGGDSITGGATGLITRKTTVTGIASRNTTSVMNFAGSEDLGGGLRAGFFHNVTLTTAAGGFGARDTWVSLSGGFGEVKIGRFTPGFETVSAAYSQGGGTSNTAGTADFMFGTAAKVNTAAAETAGPVAVYTEIGRGAGGAGVIQYTTPNMSGLYAVLAHANNSNDTSATVNKTRGTQNELAINFSSGPVSIGAGVLAHTASTENVAANTDVDMMSLGASINLDGIILRVGYLNRQEKLSTTGQNTVDADTTSVGVSIPLSGAAAAYITAFSGSDANNGEGTNNRDLSGYQAGLTYNLSKRTNLYAIYGENKFEGPGVATSSKVTGTSLGLRHSF